MPYYYGYGFGIDPRLMMSNRPKNPANARNKNVLIIGGSGSGKTRFWLKPSAPVRAV